MFSKRANQAWSFRSSRGLKASRPRGLRLSRAPSPFCVRLGKTVSEPPPPILGQRGGPSAHSLGRNPRHPPGVGAATAATLPDPGTALRELSEYLECLEGGPALTHASTKAAVSNSFAATDMHGASACSANQCCTRAHSREMHLAWVALAQAGQRVEIYRVLGNTIITININIIRNPQNSIGNNDVCAF